MSAGRRTEGIRLVAFDLDGTLLRGATVCEILAEKLGFAERMCQLEALDDLDEIAAARLEIARWYENHSIAQLQSFFSASHLAPGAVEGCKLLLSRDIHIAIASLTWSFAVEWFGKLLGARFTLGTRLFTADNIEHCWPEDKAVWIAALSKGLNCPLHNVAGVGDSFGDVPMLCRVGKPVFIGRRIPEGLPPNTDYMPGADILAVAQHILDVAENRSLL